MKYYAQVDVNNVVVNVLQLDDITDEEAVSWLTNSFGLKWVLSHSIDDSVSSDPLLFRVHAAGVGMIYDPEGDVFYAQKPFPSWVLDEVTYTWTAPIDVPSEDSPYQWDEESQSWLEIL